MAQNLIIINGKDFKPFLVAEMSGNHNGDLKGQKKLFLKQKKWSRCNKTSNIYPNWYDN